MKKDQKIYAIDAGVRFRKTPDASNRTNIIKELKKDDELIVVDGPWIKVKVGSDEGWVHRDFITEDIPLSLPVTTSSNSNLPNFTKGEPNLASDENTKKVREIIKDEFNLGKEKCCLNCTEYVLYRIKTKLGKDVIWPVKSGRDGGKWGKIFQTSGTYKVLSEPEANCAMSFTEVRLASDNSITKAGHVAFVEEVFPDDSIYISEANWPGDGKYKERKLSKAEWQNKYKGMFIKFD